MEQHFAMRLLRTFCPPHLLEEIEGDLLQRYERDVRYQKKADLRLFWNTIRYFRPGIVLRNKLSSPRIKLYMIQNNIKIAFRNFAKQKAYTLLNIVGLSLGMAASLLILQYVKYERSFDTFHSRAKDIYRIQYNGWQNGKLNFESAVAVPAVGPALKDNFPEVEQYTRFLPFGGIFSYEKSGEAPIAFREESALFADTSMFTVFDFRLATGNPATCLKGVDKVIISQKLAKKYFNNDDPIGKRLTRNGDLVFEVTGVFQDVPENSHIKFDMLISYETINAMTKGGSATSWGWYDFYSFVLLKPGTDVKALQAKWDAYLQKVRGPEWEKNSAKQEFIFRPLTDIHLHSHLLYETSPEELRDGDSVYALSVIAIFILVIAWVNYVNLATARSFKRANEVGVRKVVGAIRGQLISQFITESFLLNSIAATLAIGLVCLLWSPFSSLTGWNIPFDYVLRKEFWLLVIVLFLGGALLSGFYPAIILSSFKPIQVLKGKVIHSSSGNFLRKGLVVFQFIASVFLISGSLIVFEQLSYMKSKDLGLNITQTLVLKGPRVIADSLYTLKYQTFKNEILQIPAVKGIALSSNVPGVENYWTTGIRRISGGPEGDNVVTNMGIDHDFITQYAVKILSGRNFSREFPSDKKGILINYSLLKELEFKDAAKAVGELAVVGGDTVRIIGVIDDFHQMSLKTAIIPLVCRLRDQASYYSIKMETSNYQAAMESIENSWKAFFPGNPLDYFFLDQFFNRQYERDDRFGTVFTIFTGLAIFIASLGLVGLASFMTSQRTREIGIRKVMGSTSSGIVMLLSKGFMQPVLLGITLACPLGWWLMTKWLQSFPYRTSVHLWVFGVSGFFVILIAFISVSSQTWKAALTKPAETLKYE
ncbi:MAG TPA: ABC transporter permease [Cyclobacteriaceae bacterium]|nr:ABC transporter permease [Cyclobacteriaceae bacterium]